MVNKKKNALKTVGIVAGVVAGVTAVAAGAVALYNRYKADKFDSRCCELCSENEACPCHGKYFPKCVKETMCFVDEEENVVYDFEEVTGTTECDECV